MYQAFLLGGKATDAGLTTYSLGVNVVIMYYRDTVLLFLSVEYHSKREVSKPYS